MLDGFVILAFFEVDFVLLFLLLQVHGLVKSNEVFTDLDQVEISVTASNTRFFGVSFRDLLQTRLVATRLNHKVGNFFDAHKVLVHLPEQFRLLLCLVLLYTKEKCLHDTIQVWLVYHVDECYYFFGESVALIENFYQYLLLHDF